MFLDEFSMNSIFKDIEKNPIKRIFHFTLSYLIS